VKIGSGWTGRFFREKRFILETILEGIGDKGSAAYRGFTRKKKDDIYM